MFHSLRGRQAVLKVHQPTDQGVHRHQDQQVSLPQHLDLHRVRRLTVMVQEVPVQCLDKGVHQCHLRVHPIHTLFNG